MNDDNLKGYIFTGLDIPYQGLTIKQPSIREIIRLGWNNFDNICLPFYVNFEYLEVAEEYVEENNLKIFDVFWLADFKLKEMSALDMLVNSLKFAFDREDVTKVKVSEVEYYISVGGLKIDRYNFDELSTIIKSIYRITPYKKVEKEEKVFKSERDRARYEAYKKRQKEKSQNDGNGILEVLRVINYVIHSQSKIDYNSVLDLTLFQLFNSQNTLVNIENYDINWKVSLAGGEGKEMSHWREKFMVEQ